MNNILQIKGICNGFNNDYHFYKNIYASFIKPSTRMMKFSHRAISLQIVFKKFKFWFVYQKLIFLGYLMLMIN